MATLFTLPIAVALDGDGSPLMGAQLTFTATGTSTPLAIYSDASLSTALENPLTADALGRFSATWLQDAQYRVTLTDSAGVTQWIVDGVGTPTYSEAMTGISLGLRGLAYSYDAFAVTGAGVVTLGDGTAAADVTLSRTSADVLGLGTGDSFALDGTWDGGNLRLGNYRLWVDRNGNLRIKSGAPTGDEDGTVVGSQVGPVPVVVGALAITGYAPTLVVA